MKRNKLSEIIADRDAFQKTQVWAKGAPALGYDPSIIRQDEYGRLMAFAEYGNRESSLGWEIDHIVPKSQGGSDELFNLRPLNWQSNVNRNASLFGNALRRGLLR